MPTVKLSPAAALNSIILAARSAALSVSFMIRTYELTVIIVQKKYIRIRLSANTSPSTPRTEIIAGSPEPVLHMIMAPIRPVIRITVDAR